MNEGQDQRHRSAPSGADLMAGTGPEQAGEPACLESPLCRRISAEIAPDSTRRKRGLREMHRLIPGSLAMVFALPLTSLAQSYRAPAGQEFAKVAPGGTTILPNGRLLTPHGKRLYTDGDLWNVVPSPDGKWIVGFCESGIVVCSSKEP